MLRYTATIVEKAMHRFSTGRTATGYFNTRATTNATAQDNSVRLPDLKISLKDHLLERVFSQIDEEDESLKKSRDVCRVISRRVPYLSLKAWATPQLEIRSELTLTMKNLSEGFRVGSVKAELTAGNITDVHFTFNISKLREMHSHAGIAEGEFSVSGERCEEQLKLFAEYVALRRGIRFNALRKDLYAELLLMWLTERSFIYPQDPAFADDLFAPHLASSTVRWAPISFILFTAATAMSRLSIVIIILLHFLLFYKLPGDIVTIENDGELEDVVIFTGFARHGSTSE
ncbi:hypothetical protein FOZ63_016148 [Perkinsus olseni]|uniref:Uncharacterized protein n=1 Tax=Perkinsus olseni TaxID=32597 RepID=A0A7J6U0X8_PEROL|nr:hypothetical protein FOZ63_016148 [Perkinsus olseni]